MGRQLHAASELGLCSGTLLAVPNPSPPPDTDALEAAVTQALEEAAADDDCDSVAGSGADGADGEATERGAAAKAAKRAAATKRKQERREQIVTKFGKKAEPPVFSVASKFGK